MSASEDIITGGWPEAAKPANPMTGEYWRLTGGRVKQVLAVRSGEVKFTDGTIRNIAALREKVEPEAVRDLTIAEKFGLLVDEVGLEEAIRSVYAQGQRDALDAKLEKISGDIRINIVDGERV